MADTPGFTTNAQPTLQQLVDYLVDSLYDEKKLAQLQRTLRNAGAEASTIADGVATAVLDPLLEKLGQFMFFAEKHVETIAGPPLSRLAGHLIGQDVPISELRKSAAAGEGSVGRAIAKFAMEAMRPKEAGEIAPGTENARRFLSLVAQLVVNGWFEGTAFELITTMFPDMDAFEKVAELPHELVDALGLGRLARVALRPLIQATVATPLEWEVHKKYMPTLLGVSTALRAFFSGRWDWEDVEEELSRAGYSGARIHELLSEQMKRPSVEEIELLVRHGDWRPEKAIQTLRDDGYDEEGALLALRREGLKRVEAANQQSMSALVAAVADRRIDSAELVDTARALGIPAADIAIADQLANLRRTLDVKFLSATQARDCVKAKILNVIDYRRALEREGYAPDAVLALELLLRHELDEKAEVEKVRAELVAQRDAEKKALEAERAKRAADVEAANALHRRGTITDLRAAVVRGLIPIARLEEVLVAMYDRDTVGIYMGLVEDERQAYLAQQQRADAARQRAQRGGLNEGQLAAGVLANVLTLDQYRDSLQRAGLAAADVAVLVATLAAKKKAMDDARTKRAQADAAAARKSIDLSRFEQLVRRGHRTIAEYDALLASLEFDEPSRAGMVELLQLKIADDADARALRAATGHTPGPRGLTLEQLRAAVIAGNASIADFQRYLDDAKYTADAQVVLLAELRDDVAAADAARQRRSQTSATSGGAALPLSRLLAAARLGILPPAEYQRRLEAAGYSADDVAIEMDLLLTEISQVQAARAKQNAVAASAADKGLTLAEIAHAVKMGVTTIDAYRARAVELGLDAGDVAIVVGVLEQELLVLKDAKSRRTAIAADLVARGVALSDLDDQVIAGTMTVGAYQQSLEELGVAADDADYLGALLVVQLEAADAGVA